MKKRQRKIRLIRAGIQLLFFIFAPALFSTAFAGVKSVFQAIAAHQAISWNSFLDVTAVLLVVTCLFGRHFCGYACAFGSLGDASTSGKNVHPDISEIIIELSSKTFTFIFSSYQNLVLLTFSYFCLKFRCFLP